MTTKYSCSFLTISLMEIYDSAKETVVKLNTIYDKKCEMPMYEKVAFAEFLSVLIARM